MVMALGVGVGDGVGVGAGVGADVGVASGVGVGVGVGVGDGDALGGGVELATGEEDRPPQSPTSNAIRPISAKPRTAGELTQGQAMSPRLVTTQLERSTLHAGRPDAGIQQTRGLAHAVTGATCAVT